MSSDPASYIQARPTAGRHIALTLRGTLHEHHTTYDVSREDALRLFSDLSHVLFATASHDPRPTARASVTDNDEIDAIVGALAALTDRVRELEERTVPVATPSAVTPDEGEAEDPGPRPRDGGRHDDAAQCALTLRGVVDLLTCEIRTLTDELMVLRSCLRDEKPRRTS